VLPDAPRFRRGPPTEATKPAQSANFTTRPCSGRWPLAHRAVISTRSSTFRGSLRIAYYQSVDTGLDLSAQGASASANHWRESRWTKASVNRRPQYPDDLSESADLTAPPTGGDRVGVHQVPELNLFAFVAALVCMVDRWLLRPGRVVLERHCWGLPIGKMAVEGRGRRFVPVRQRRHRGTPERGRNRGL